MGCVLCRLYRRGRGDDGAAVSTEDIGGVAATRCFGVAIGAKHHLMRLMIELSDNTATNLILDFFAAHPRRT